MKNTKNKCAKRLCLLAIALAAVIGFSFAALSLTGCGDGGGGGPGDPLQLNGTYKAADGETITLTNGSFVIAQNNEQVIRGTYTASARSISANISMAIKELHGDYLTEEMNEDDDDDPITFESKWYNKNQLIDALKKYMKDAGATDAQITAYFNAHSGDFDDMFPTITGTIDGDTMALTYNGETTTYTKQGGISNPDTTPGGSSGGWTAIANSTFGDTDINAIAYGGGKFVAVGNSGKMATSPDGKTWTAVNVASTFGDNEIYSIAYGNGKFVAGGYRKMAYSSDGVTWTVANGTFGTDNIHAIAYANNTFVAGVYNTIATSTDGVTWTSGASLNSVFGGYIEAIAFGNDKFIAAGASYNKIVYSSDNGTTWTEVTYNPYAEFGTRKINAIAYGNGKFVVGDSYGKMGYSSDSTTWTAVTDSKFPTSGNGILAIAYANNKFVAGGANGKMATSTDGVTWTAVNTGTIFNYSITNLTLTADIRAIAYGNGTFVAGGGKGKMAYSTGN